MKKKITKQVVDGLKPDQIIWDETVTGFGIRRQKSEAKTFILKTQVNGRQKQFTIGRFGHPFTVETARNEAKKVLGQTVQGIDPRRETVRSGRITIGELCQIYLKDYAEENKKPRSVKTDRNNIKNHVFPLLGEKYVEDLTVQDVEEFKKSVKNGSAPKSRNQTKGARKIVGGAGISNRCLSLLSKMLACALEWGYRSDGQNPVKSIKRYTENKRERYLSSEEYKAISIALEEEAEYAPYGVFAIKLLILTGARLGEILELKWEYVDFDREMALLPDSKTGQRQLFFSKYALEMLNNIPKQLGNPFVICGRESAKHLVGMGKIWKRIKIRAVAAHWRERYPEAVSKECSTSLELLIENLAAIGIEEKQVYFLKPLRIHDLRHNFASVYVSAGNDIYQLSKLLGHKTIKTTERYAHLTNPILKKTNEQVAAIISNSLVGE